MQISEIRYEQVRPIEGYGPGFFRIGGARHAGPLLVLPRMLRPWCGFDDPAPLRALAGEVDVLLVGTGGEIRHLPPALSRLLEGDGLGVEIMASPTACRSYNMLLAEGRRVAAALLPVPEGFFSEPAPAR